MPAALALALALTLPTQDTPLVLPERERAALHDRILRRRLETLAPTLLRREGIDVWIVSGREHDEDPVLETMLPATWLSARRRTILVLRDPGGEAPLERLAVARYDVGELFTAAWNPDTDPDQWARLAELLRGWDPRRIAIDVSAVSAHADGLSASERDALLAALAPELRERVVPAEPLAIGWLEGPSSTGTGRLTLPVLDRPGCPPPSSPTRSAARDGAPA